MYIPKLVASPYGGGGGGSPLTNCGRGKSPFDDDVGDDADSRSGNPCDVVFTTARTTRCPAQLVKIAHWKRRFFRHHSNLALLAQ